MFPNPASENLTIQLPSGSKNASVVFYDYIGRTALTQKVTFPSFVAGDFQVKDQSPEVEGVDCVILCPLTLVPEPAIKEPTFVLDPFSAVS